MTASALIGVRDQHTKTHTLKTVVSNTVEAFGCACSSCTTTCDLTENSVAHDDKLCAVSRFVAV